ncbi:MAG: hypothetical protein FWE24_08970 [Defluviitaleaceae bacterium]|nr:hypothetical protein [Defluviitaleaceae bacterium]
MEKSKGALILRRELHYFDIYPKVVPAFKSSAIKIKCRENYFKPKDGPIKVRVIPMSEFIKVMLNPSEAEAYSEDGIIHITYHFEKEQEYRLKVQIKENEWAELSVYALEEDLYKLIPLKGETHAHTNISDGWESPEVVAAYYRKAGFDFMVISDHKKYQGGEIAREFYKGVNIDLEIISGEEIHAPLNPVHIVNFGGSFSISELIEKDQNSYSKAVQEIITSLDSSYDFVDDKEQYVYASCLWVYDKIKEAGGLSIFCHPHALVGGMEAYNVQDTLITLQFKNKCFDALELVGGRSPAENNMQLAFYLSACKKGYGNFSIVGGSDSHGVLSEPFPNSSLKENGVYRPYGFDEIHTIVFAKSNEKAEIISAIKNGYSVAIDKYKGETARVHGDYRLVSYGLFLLSEYFPLHHEICYEEGRLMLQMAYDDLKCAADELNAKAGQVEDMIRKYMRQ